MKKQMLTEINSGSFIEESRPSYAVSVTLCNADSVRYYKPQTQLKSMGGLHKLMPRGGVGMKEKEKWKNIH